MDQEDRKQFDNAFYNHQDTMKGIEELKAEQQRTQELLRDMGDKVDKLILLYTDLQEKYVNENNLLRQELTGRR
jgi:hypothetical protein|tara:strand:+ start:169 stop:390 length:222 start_codon:yes stop_codon:yes gene_type:complete